MTSTQDSEDFTLFDLINGPGSIAASVSSERQALLNFAPPFQQPKSNSSDNSPSFEDETSFQGPDHSSNAYRTPTSDSSTSLSRSDVTTSEAHMSRSRSPVSRSRVEKRQANTLAARRYRQKRVSHVNELEAALEAIKAERDSLRVRVGELEGETRVLKGLVGGT